MTPSEFSDEIEKHYFLPDGLVSFKIPAENHDNHYLSTSTYCSLLRRNLPRTEWEIHPHVLAFRKYLTSHRREPGLYDVDPSWADRTLSHDELNGQAAFSKEIARELLRRARRNFWVFRNRPWSEVFAPIRSHYPSDSSEKHFVLRVSMNRLAIVFKKFRLTLKELSRQWMYRFGYLVAFIKVQAGSYVWPHEQLWYFLHCIRVSRNEWGNTSGKCLLALHAEAFPKMPWLMRKGWRLFEKRIYLDYGHAGGLYAVYYNPETPHVGVHPFAKLLWGKTFFGLLPTK